MSSVNLAYLVPTIFALVLALYPAPWHLRTRNIATLSMIFWMTSLNLVHLVNCIVWDNNVDIKAKVWGDISTTVIVGYNFGLPLAHLILAKQLESYTSLRPKGPLYDQASRDRHRRFDLIASMAGPIVGILLHLSLMDRRFYVVQGFGPMPATWWAAWGVIWMAIVPITIAFGCLIYTVMALVNIHLRRQQMLSIIASDASVNREQFYRLLFLTLAELATCGFRAVFNLLSFQHGPQPLGHRGEPRHNLSIVEVITSDEISSTGRLVLRLQFFTVVACSYVFFLCFATSTETKKFYRRVVGKFIPCVDAEPEGRGIKLGSLDSGASRSNPSTSTSSYPLKSPTSPTSPITPDLPSTPRTPRADKGDMSLLEMLDTPPPGHRLEKNAPWGRGRRERWEDEEVGFVQYESGKGEAK